ncbi:hypothetical protein ARMSODRAFT_1048758 [Armillaria solidipes]|uniref:Uncharacterized protein n=1 Tax=Armillaria solidipes TaxID=1076256 RepID=A0A2H3BQI9_9AGAR|nr:hypothetical protein ARMSODRAFT_1048758 [Armillaria solidipes]
MAGWQFHLKPRPVSLMHGHSNYLPFKWPFDFDYGPFFPDYGPIPSDSATAVYTVQSSALPATLSMLYDDLIPTLDVEVPCPNRLPRSAWWGLLRLAMNKVDASFRFRMECENHIVQLTKGDRAPTPPPPSDVELYDKSEPRDAELELYIWAYMYHLADERTCIWRSFRQEMYQLIKPFSAACLPSGHNLFNLVSSKALAAASVIASAFTTETSIDGNEPPLLSPSSSSGSSPTDSTTSSHAGDLDDDDNDADSSALHHLSRFFELALILGEFLLGQTSVMVKVTDKTVRKTTYLLLVFS